MAKLTTALKRQCAGIRNWSPINENYAAGEFYGQLQGWSKPRRFIVIREQIREDKEAVGRRLIDLPGYTFRLWVTDREESPLALWQEYNGRATVEQRIEELNNELSADAFCMEEFFSTEAFLAVLFTFNLLSLYQHMVTPTEPYRQTATLRSQVFIAGALLGHVGKHLPLKLSAPGVV